MSEMKQFPGPCEFNGNEIVETDNPRVGVAGIAHNVPDGYGYMFAAAPELYEALEEMESVFLVDMPNDEEVRAKAQAALAKARGDV